MLLSNGNELTQLLDDITIVGRMYPFSKEAEHADVLAIQDLSDLLLQRFQPGTAFSKPSSSSILTRQCGTAQAGNANTSGLQAGERIVQTASAVKSAIPFLISALRRLMYYIQAHGLS